MGERAGGLLGRHGALDLRNNKFGKGGWPPPHCHPPPPLLRHQCAAPLTVFRLHAFSAHTSSRSSTLILIHRLTFAELLTRLNLRDDLCDSRARAKAVRVPSLFVIR